MEKLAQQPGSARIRIAGPAFGIFTPMRTPKRGFT